MNSIHIDDLKVFTGKLFIKEDFDELFLNEASITTFNTYTIDGHITKDFYTNEEFEEMGKPALSKWKDMKHFCFSFIKGTKIPLKFKIVLELGSDGVKSVIEESGVPFKAEDVQGLYINIKYENGNLDCISGTSLKIFSMDKSLENAWDKEAEKFILSLI